MPLQQDLLIAKKRFGKAKKIFERQRIRANACIRFLFAQLSAVAIISFIGRTVAYMTPIHTRNFMRNNPLNRAIVRRKRPKECNTLLASIEGIGGHTTGEKGGTNGRDTDENDSIEDANPKENESFNQFNVVNDLISVSERLLDNLDTTSSTFTSRNKSYSSLTRLSKAHHTMMAKTSNMRRQRFVTGKYPLYVSVKRNPTNKWLGLAESQIYLNGTSIEKSMASYDIFNWLDDQEREELHGDYEFLSLELLAEIRVKQPGYVNVLPKRGAGMSLAQPKGDDGVLGGWRSWKLRDALASKIGEDIQEDRDGLDGERLWVTGFSLTKQRGELHTLDVESGAMSNVNDKTASSIKWPNEVASIPRQSSHGKKEDELEDALLISDGFLVPGKDKGGLYVVKNPGNALSEWRVCLTGITNLQDVTINAGEGDWFYHRAIWMDLTGDGRLSILAARAKFPLLQGTNGDREVGGGTMGKGQLVWLERPMPHSIDASTGTPLDVDQTLFDPFSTRNAPWKVRVLTEGPDVMFSVADLDSSDDTIEIIASQFFSKKLTLHSLKIGPDPKIVFQRTIDDRCGAAFSSILADLDGLATLGKSKDQPKVVDSGSTVVTLNEGDAFSHLLVTSHECSSAESSAEVNAKFSQRNTITEVSLDHTNTLTTDTINAQSKDEPEIDGGSLFAYRIPPGKDAWKTKPWPRNVIATGFKVQGQLNNMINPGAPGFCYTFFPTREGGVGRDKKWQRPLIGISGDCAESAYILRPTERSSSSFNHCAEEGLDKSTKIGRAHV